MLVRLDVNGGPAAARNRALAEVETELVAMIDSDCRPSADWISRLAAQLADESVAIAAPRIVASEPVGALGAYSAVCGGLDLGPREGRVVPLTRLAYVPTAALVARRTALFAVARAGEVFDPALRFGEDVDLMWRLAAAGWHVRYDPSVEVRHDEPGSWPALFERRFRYGTSATPLARRHPGAMAPFVAYPGPLVTALGAVTRRPVLALAGIGGTYRAARATLARAGLGDREAVAITRTATVQTAIGVSRYATQFASPALLAAALAPGRPGRRWAAAALLTGSALADWITLRPRLDPVRFVLARVADQVSYGAGVWASAWRGRSVAALQPKLLR